MAHNNRIVAQTGVVATARNLLHAAAMRPWRTQRGFNLMEVLVALVVLALGLLGLAALQTRALRNSQSAYYRSVATALANDMADRIRGNRTAHLAGAYTIHAGDAPPADTSNCGPRGITCAPDAVANYDMSYWKCSLGSWNDHTICRDHLNVQGDLPAGDGAIARIADGTSAGAPLYTITVMWDDARQGVTGTDCGDDPRVDLTCLTTTFQP